MHPVGSKAFVISPKSSGLPSVLPATIVEVVVRTTADGERRSYILDFGNGEHRAIKSEAVLGNIEDVRIELQRRMDQIVNEIVEAVCKPPPHDV